MKKIVFLFLATIWAIIPSAFAYDFSTVAPSGQTLYYNIVGGNAQVTHVYSYCPTGALVIPDSVTYLGTTYAVTSIDEGAFGCSDLTSVTIPASVTDIGVGAFTDCSSLASLIVSSGNTVYDSRNNCNAIIETSSNTLVVGCMNTVIPATVTKIGLGAFAYCYGLTSITIPNGVTSIGDYAFVGCSGLTTVTIPNGVTSIGMVAFNDCAGLTSVTIPNSVTKIMEAAFGNCSGLTSLIVTNGNTVYDSRNNCNAIIETSSNTLVAGCMNTVIPATVTKIGKCAFEGCYGLTSITIPDGVAAIDTGAFWHCSGLTSVTIGSGVTSIAIEAFSGCTGLTEIHSSAIVPPALRGVHNYMSTDDEFYNVSRHIPVYVPGCALEAYQSSTEWNYFFTNYQCVYPYSFIIGLYLEGYIDVAWDTCDHSKVTLTAIPDDGYNFDHWSDGNTDNPRTLTLTQDTSLVAYFETATSPSTEDIMFTVVANNAMGGGVYPAGSTAVLFALPHVDLQFAGWSDNVTTNPRYIVVTSDTTLTALFRTPDTMRVYVTTTVYDTVINIVYDTTEYNHYYYDTTRIYDTLVVFDTLINVVYDTTEYNHYFYDTTYVYDTLVVYDTAMVYDTMVYVNIDTMYHYYYDTVINTVYDTTEYNHYIYDTTHVYDTLVIYDTTMVFDTLVYMSIDTLHHYYYDTTRIFDTMVYVNYDTLNHYYYDTTTVYDTLIVLDTTRIYDTIIYVNIDTVHHYFYDTVINTVYDTMEYNHYIYDTTRVYDTLIVLDSIIIYDTIVYVIIDTLYNYYFDTTSVTHYVFDSTWVFDSIWVFDSVWVYDSVYVIDTVYFFDTVYIDVPVQGIEGVETVNVIVYTYHNRITVEGAEGLPLRLYDVSGRLLETKVSDGPVTNFFVQTSGTYLVRVGDLPARRVVVIR